jgi:hypothetical protein
MNERIRKLLNEATSGLEPDISPQRTVTLNEMEKFAELIVFECINIGDNYEDILGNEPECFNCRKVAYGIVDKIKQRFGVE